MKQVLIIDDDPSVRMTLKVLLRKAGHAFTEAANGQQGTEMASALLPDLVICDVNMGAGLDGFGVIEILRMNEPTASTPVLLITGAPVNPAKLIHNRMVEFLEKPFGMNEFLAAVSRMLAMSPT